MPDQELKIVAVEVPEESLQTNRVPKGGDRHRYSVSCGCLARSMAGPDWDVGEDPATIMVRSRTLQQVRALMYKYRGAVESAVKQGATVKQQAEAEDEKLKAPRGGDDGGDQSIASNQPHDQSTVISPILDQPVASTV